MLTIHLIAYSLGAYFSVLANLRGTFMALYADRPEASCPCGEQHMCEAKETKK